MMSGLWVSATTPSDASVLASFVVSSDNNSNSNNSSVTGGMLSVCQKWSHGHADIRAYTFASAIASAHYASLPGWNVYGNVDASGLAWLACHVSPLEWFRKPSQTTYYRNNPFADDDEEKQTAAEKTIQKIQLGSSLQLQSPCKMTDLSDIQLQHVCGYASVDVAGCTVVMEATVPIKTLDPQVAYYFSANLSAVEGPPLTISMQSSPTRSSMNLSQVLTFDRYVLNAFETRCPRIRNSLGWAVQMKKEQNVEKVAQLTAGLAWQLNRAICVKLLVANSGDDAGLTGALLLKRWQQPRVLVSLLAGIAPGKNVSYGFGLELETGPQVGQDYYKDKEENRSHVEEQAPATKATLPNVD
jgi:hypothetical protein